MSSVPIVLAALASLGQSTLASNVQVINGDHRSTPLTLERYFLVGDDELVVDRQFDSMASVTTSEEYTVPLTAGADLATADQTVADAEADAVYEAMLTAILGHPSGPNMGLGESISILPVGEHRFVRAPSQNGRHAAWRWGVRVYAQNS